MKQFIVKRLAQMLFIWILVSMFSFSIIYFAPGDPLYIYMTPGATGHKMTDEEMYRMRESLGLNGNVVEQYVSWAKKTARGNLGISISNRQPVLDQILEKLPCTAGLMGASLLLSLAISIPLGLLAGVYKNRLPDHIISGFTYLGISVPAFWLGIMLIIIFSMKLKILPSSGMRTIGVDSAWDLIRHGIMPAIVLGLNNMAVFVRYIRANTIVQLEEEYVQTAISKGLSKRGILYGQVLKNCMLPVITTVGSRLGTLVTGSFIIESVFAWPGLGTLGMSAINNRDYPMIMGITMFSCTILLLGNFLAALRAEDFARAELGGEEKAPDCGRGLGHQLKKAFWENKMAAVSLAILILIAAGALAAPFLPQDPDYMDVLNKMAPPSGEHWLGTDELGRDTFTRVLYGSRISLLVGIATMIVSVVAGTLVGTISGYAGGKTDAVLMRIVDMFQSVPSLLMIIVIFSFIPNNMVTLVFMLALFSWTGVARIVRAQTLTLKERDFVAAARTLGVGHTAIIMRHIIPNMSAQIIVAASLSIAGAILDESALSFLGYGVALPMSSWGSMLQNAQQYILYDPLLALVPGLFILLTVLCLNILGDALQYALDPRLHK